MIWQSNLYAVPLLVGAALLIILALVGWRRDSTLAVSLFFVYALFVAGLMIAYALELLSASLGGILFWQNIQHIFFCTPVIWLLFVMVYTGHQRWLTPRRVALLFFIPVCQALAAWTNDFHQLYWTAVGLGQADGLVFFLRGYGPLFYLGMGYLYLVTGLAALLMIGDILRRPSAYRGQIMLLVSAALMPALGNLFTLAGLADILRYDLTPLGFALGCVALGWNLFRQGLFDIIPAAYGKVVASMSDAIIILNVENRIVNVNPAAEALTGLERAALIGRFAPDILPCAPPFFQHYASVTEAQDEISLGSGETLRYYDLRLSGIHNRGGRLTGRVIVLRDITGRKQAEQMIRQYTTELEARNSELDSFSHTVAHDLKAPIGILTGYIHILRQHEDLSPTARAYLQSMEKAALRMENMITGLLLLARMRNISDAVVPVDMTQAAQAALERFQVTIEERAIQVDITPHLPAALGYDVWLEEVFANLISNAIKYIGRDNPAPRIRISGTRQGDYARYEVHDNGVGISAEDQAGLFDMFSRFHQDQAVGTGLGLSIFQRIVTRLKGQVGVESQPGAGSIFWFTLPAASESASDHTGHSFMETTAPDPARPG
jgi:PAS domain S-box-containing protein